jgi:hypothetical protein
LFQSPLRLPHAIGEGKPQAVGHLEQHPKGGAGVITFEVCDGGPAHSDLRRKLRRGDTLTQAFFPKEKNDQPFNGVYLSWARHPA